MALGLEYDLIGEVVPGWWGGIKMGWPNGENSQTTYVTMKIHNHKQLVLGLVAKQHVSSPWHNDKSSWDGFVLALAPRPAKQRDDLLGGALRGMIKRNTESGRKIIGAITVVQWCNGAILMARVRLRMRLWWHLWGAIVPLMRWYMRLDVAVYSIGVGEP